MNNIIRNLSAILFIASLVSGCALKPSKTTDHIITFSPLDKDHIKVEYKPTSSLVELQDKYDNRAPRLRKNWKALDTCGELIDGAKISLKENCKSTSFSVPIAATIVDRVEPMVYPMGEEGVLVHTGTFGINADNVIWKFKSPRGDLIAYGKVLNTTKTSITQTNENRINYNYIFLSYKKLKKTQLAIVATDTPQQLRDTIIESRQTVNDYFSQQYPSIKPMPLVFFVNNITNGKRAYHQADVSTNLIRLGFFNWNEDYISKTKGVVAHEVAHTLQPKKLKSLDNHPIIREGGAEFIQRMTEYKLGWRDKNYLAEEFSNAIAYCLNYSEGKTWNGIKSEIGKIPYQCGLAIHVIALALRQNTESAEATLELFYKTATENSDTDFIKSVECGSLVDCKPQFLNNFFSDETSIATALDSALDKLAIVKSKGYKSLSQSAIKSFSRLRKEDCGSQDGQWIRKDHFVVDDRSKKCRSLNHELKITKVEGVSYFDDPAKAIEAQNRGCRTQKKVTLETLDKQLITVTCTTEVVKDYYVIDIDKLLTLLEKR